MTLISSPRGFAAMDMARRRELAKKGGVAAHQNGAAHKFNVDEARVAGRKGGQIVSQDRAHMAKIGKKGGKKSGMQRRTMENTNGNLENTNGNLENTNGNLMELIRKAVAS